MKAVADVVLCSLEYMGLRDDVPGIADIYTTGSVEEELNEIAGFRDKNQE